MNTLLVEFEKKIRKYHSKPEAIAIDYKEIGYPFYTVMLDLTYSSNRNLELQEEFVLKCLTLNLNEKETIANFLGVDEHFVETVLSGLISKNLVVKQENLQITELGYDTLVTQTVLDLSSETKTFYIDALNGKFYDYFQSNSIKKGNVNCLTAIVPKPRKGRVEDVIDYYEDIEKILKNFDSQSKVQLIQVNNIEKIYKKFHEIIFVFYKSSPDDSEVEYETFSRGNIDITYRKSIEQLYAQGKKILSNILEYDISTDEEIEVEINNALLIKGISKNTINDVEKLSTKISVLSDTESFPESASQSVNEQRKILTKELNEIKTQSKISEIIHTFEHRKYLFQALKEAQKRVMIVSPWIRANVIDSEFLSLLDAALAKKIQVYILYGLKQKFGIGQQNDVAAVKKLENLAIQYKNFNFQKVNNTHRKTIVCDNKFGVITSFNFLSFRADPSLTYRDELGVVLRDKETVESLFQSGLSLASYLEKA